MIILKKSNTYLPFLPMASVEAIVLRAIEEDVLGGDLTSSACIDDKCQLSALAVARNQMIAAGSFVAACVFSKVDPALTFETLASEGDLVERNQPLWRVFGNARSILMGERVALNFIQRLSGIATMTHEYVSAIPKGLKTHIADTRKTMPGLRLLDRYAVRVGGGHNHRDSLSSAILIKDNHIAACGGITKAIERAKAFAPHTSRIECEVDSIDQLKEAIAAGAEVVLLDNMDISTIEEAVKLAGGKVILEASGGVTLQTIPSLARAGVDIISVGALTHSVHAADIGLDIL